MRLDFKKMVLEKWVVSLQFETNKIANINPKHFIQLTRPKINLESIAEQVRHNYTDQIAKWLFGPEIEKQMNEEIKKTTARCIEQNTLLPAPIIFIWSVLEAKYKNGGSVLKLWVSPSTAIYIINNNGYLASMIFDLWTYPQYLSSSFDTWTKEECNKVLEIKDTFLEEYPASIEMEDCFDPMIKFVNEDKFGKTSAEYKRKKFKHKDKVLYEE